MIGNTISNGSRCHRENLIKEFAIEEKKQKKKTTQKTFSNISKVEVYKAQTLSSISLIVLFHFEK